MAAIGVAWIAGVVAGPLAAAQVEAPARAEVTVEIDDEDDLIPADREKALIA